MSGTAVQMPFQISAMTYTVEMSHYVEDVTLITKPMLLIIRPIQDQKQLVVALSVVINK